MSLPRRGPVIPATLALILLAAAPDSARSQQLAIPPELIRLHAAATDLAAPPAQVVNRDTTYKRLDSLTLWANRRGWSERVGQSVWPIPGPGAWSRSKWEPPAWVVDRKVSIGEVVEKAASKDELAVRQFVEKEVAAALNRKNPLNEWALVELMKRDEWNKFAHLKDRIELLQKAAELPGVLRDPDWTAVGKRLAAVAPNWLDLPPREVLALRREVEAVLADLAKHGESAAAVKHAAIEEPAAVSFVVPLNEKKEPAWVQYGVLGAALSEWNELVGLLSMRDGPPPAAGQPPGPKLPPGSAQLTAAADLVGMRMPKSHIDSITGPDDELAKGLGFGETQKSELLALLKALRSEPQQVLEPPLRAAAFMAARKELLTADIQTLRGTISASLKNIEEAYSKLALGLPAEEQKANLAKLDDLWADLVRQVLATALLRREADVLAADLGAALGAAIAAVRDNVRNMTDALELTLGLRLEQTVRSWDAKHGLHNLTLRDQQVLLTSGQVDPTADPEKAAAARDQARARTNSALLRFWGPVPAPPAGQNPWPRIQVRETAFKEYGIDIDPLNKNLVTHRRPTIRQVGLMNWASQVDNKAGGLVRVELFCHRVVLDGKWDLGAPVNGLILNDLLIVASEVEFGSGLSFAVPEGCAVTILTHSLTQKRDVPVPPVIMLQGPNAHFCCFSSQFTTAPEFVRVAGPGRFDFLSDTRNPDEAWGSLAGGSKDVNRNMTDFWLQMNEMFSTKFLSSGTYTAPQKVAALVEVMSVPRYAYPADDTQKNKVSAIDNQFADYRKRYLDGHLHTIIDTEAARELPVFLEPTAGGGFTAYLLPDELWIDDTQVPDDRLGFLHRNLVGASYTVVFTLRAEVSRYARTRGRAIVAARFGAVNIVEGTPPAKYRVVFSRADGVQALGPNCPVEEVGLDTEKKLVDAALNTQLRTKSMSFSELVATSQLLCADDETAALTMELQKLERDDVFVPTEMHYKLPLSFGRRVGVKPEMIDVTQAGEQVTFRNKSKATVRVHRLVSGNLAAALVPVPPDCVLARGDKMFPLGPSPIKAIASRQQYPAVVNPFDLYSVVGPAKWTEYSADLTGFIEAKIPEAGGGGTFLDLGESRVSIWYRNDASAEFAKWREWRLTEYRATEKMNHRWHGPAGVVFKVEVECRPYGAKEPAKVPARKLVFLLDEKTVLDLSKVDVVNNHLKNGR